MLSSEEREALINGIASTPDGGDLIPETGGLRKRRIPLPGRGKRGGARVLTLYLGENRPVYALYLFAKNTRADVSPAQRKALMRIVKDIKDSAGKIRR